MTTETPDRAARSADTGGTPETGRSLSTNMAAYRSGCEAYALAVTAAHRSRTEAEERYRAEVAGVREAARQAVARREAATRKADQAVQLVAETDDAAAEIWRKLAAFTDRRKLGLTPAPDLATGPRNASEVRSLLATTRKNIGLAQRGELPFSPPVYAIPIAGAIGAVGGVIAAWAGGLLLAAGQTGSDGAAAAFHALALVVVFVGLFAGIPAVAGWLTVRHRLGPKPVHLLASVIGAVIGLCAMAPFTMLA